MAGIVYPSQGRTMTKPTTSPPPMCGSCGAFLQPPNPTCQVCGTSQWPQPQRPPYQPQMAPHPYAPANRVVVTAKSSGIAVLLSLLWVGAGNIYSGQIVLGLVLMLVDIPLTILAFTGFGLIIAVPVWLILFVISLVVAIQGVKTFNERNGIVLR
jgi:hypothetical protein